MYCLSSAFLFATGATFHFYLISTFLGTNFPTVCLNLMMLLQQFHFSPGLSPWQGLCLFCFWIATPVFQTPDSNSPQHLQSCFPV